MVGVCCFSRSIDSLEGTSNIHGSADTPSRPHHYITASWRTIGATVSNPPSSPSCTHLALRLLSSRSCVSCLCRSLSVTLSHTRSPPSSPSPSPAHPRTFVAVTLTPGLAACVGTLCARVRPRVAVIAAARMVEAVVARAAVELGWGVSFVVGVEPVGFRGLWGVGCVGGARMWRKGCAWA